MKQTRYATNVYWFLFNLKLNKMKNKKNKGLFTDVVKSFGNGFTIGEEIFKVFASIVGFIKSIWAKIDLKITNIYANSFSKIILILLSVCIIIYTWPIILIIGIIIGVYKNYNK